MLNCICFFWQKKTELYEDRKSQRAKKPAAKAPSEFLKQRMANYTKSGTYYPQGMKRVRPSYDMDHNPKIEAYTQCCKEFPGFNKKMGNLEIIRCLDHRIALGFHISKTEGLNDVFSPLFEFWSEAPSVFVAGLHDVCLYFVFFFICILSFFFIQKKILTATRLCIVKIVSLIGGKDVYSWLIPCIQKITFVVRMHFTRPHLSVQMQHTLVWMTLVLFWLCLIFFVCVITFFFVFF